MEAGILSYARRHGLLGPGPALPNGRNGHGQAAELAATRSPPRNRSSPARRPKPRGAIREAEAAQDVACNGAHAAEGSAEGRDLGAHGAHGGSRSRRPDLIIGVTTGGAFVAHMLRELVHPEASLGYLESKQVWSGVGVWQSFLNLIQCVR